LKPGISRRQAVKTASWLTAAAPIIASGLVFAATEGQRNQPALSQLDAAFRNATSAAHIPCVVAMAAAGDDILYEGVFSSRHLGDGQAMSRDTVFRVASMVPPLRCWRAMMRPVR
jgi:CubicO group peptidase (beta-lactamase class C family)